MKYKLCTTEKPSVAADIARVIGADKKEDGFFIGNGYIVTWAVGHLVGLAEPEAYGYVGLENIWDKEQPEIKEKAYKELPLIPDKFKIIVLEQTKKQFEIIKNLMHREDVEFIIDCGDMGAEGHILQWLIREKAGNIKPVKRFCAVSMTDEAIREAMRNLKNADEYKSLIIGEYCKKRADWILGMSVSRCASIKYSAKIDVGRVQSPTLYFVVKRFLEVNTFKTKNYYIIKAECDRGINLYWKKDNEGIFEDKDKDKEQLLLNRIIAENAVQEIKKEGAGKILAIERKKKSVDRPQLYDITELQRDGNRLYGYTADDTLKTAQSLYEQHKILSYPRTDSRYLTRDLEIYIKDRLKQIATLKSYNSIACQFLAGNLNIDKRIIDDSKVTDHHALIVTKNIEGFNIEKLNDKEKNILHLIIARMLVALSGKYTYEETIMKVMFNNGIIVSAGGRKVISWGWQAVQKLLMRKKEEQMVMEEQEQIFPDIKTGQRIFVKHVEVIEKQTMPPKLHTEASLLTAMENAGSQISNGEILKGRGIGTQATRAAIIKSLFDKGYIKTKTNSTEKINYLVPTKQGINVVKVIPSDLYSPKITADWEEKIEHIVNGRMTERDFMREFDDFIRDKINEIKNSEVKNVDFSSDQEEFAKCPWCRLSVYEGKIKSVAGKMTDIYYCSNKCGFFLKKDNTIFTSRTKKNITTAQMRKLINAGNIVVDCINKNNMKYNGKFTIIKNDKGYATLEFSFTNKK